MDVRLLVIHIKTTALIVMKLDKYLTEDPKKTIGLSFFI